ncbi:hypothetical protein JOC34_000231 [Virgibacillus halotolerans]|nr:hypothetical protein [Virgibacillus halotolerans]
MVSIIFITGCSDKKGDESKSNNQETNNVQEDESENLGGEQKEDAEEGDNEQENDIPTGHQDGLTMEESGYVEDADDQYKVTINSIDKDGDIGIDPSISNSDAYAVANLTVENIDDHSFNAKSIFSPSFSGSTEVYSTTINDVLFDIDEINVDLLEGEIDPGESVTGDVVFGMDKNESKDGKYYFEIGTKQDQIIQAARWELEESDLD